MTKKLLRFTEPGCGLVMEIGKWYVIADSGSAYSSTGFSSPEAAEHWWETDGRTEYEMPNDVHIPLVVPNFVNGQWDDSGSPQCMKADHLYEFWMANPLEGCDLEEEYEDG